MSNVTTISSKFQISVPKQVRAKKKWQVGQKLAYIPHGDGYLLWPVPKIEELRGIAKGANLGDYRDRADRY